MTARQEGELQQQYLLMPPKRGRTKEFALAGNSLQNASRRSTEIWP